MTKMTAHEHYIKNAVLKSFSQLRQDLETSLAGRGDPLGPSTLDVRQLTMDFDHTPTIVRRVYIEANDSSALSSVGWVTNESMPFCMECLKSFSLFTRRHHCRACGVVVCNDCCGNRVILRDFEELGLQRVCHMCNLQGATTLRIKNNLKWGESILTDVDAAEAERTAAEEASRAAEKAKEAERLLRIAQLRQAQEAEAIAEAATAVAQEAPIVKVIPFPGFVIKARRVGQDEDKVFINVFHHTTIKDPHMMLLYVPYTPPTSPESVAEAQPTVRPASSDGAANNTNTGNGNGVEPASPTTTGSTVTPLIYTAVERSSTSDRDGYVHLLLNVLVSSAYFERTAVAEQELSIAHPCSVNKIIQVVNQRYKETLSEDSFVLPRVKLRYHGPAITKAIAFQRADCAVRHVPASLLCSARMGNAADDSSVASRGVTTQQLQAAAIRANSANKLKRLSSGRPASPGNGLDGDNMSVTSDLTVASNFSQAELGYVREHRRFALTKSRSVQGHMVISDEMLRLNARLTMSLEASNGLKEQSLTDPSVLVGYQIVLPYNQDMEAAFKQSRTVPLIDKSYIYIVIDTAKNNLRKTEYKITNNLSGDAWVKLKRGKGKQGVEFRVLRKVHLVTTATTTETDTSAAAVGKSAGIAAAAVDDQSVE